MADSRLSQRPRIHYYCTGTSRWSRSIPGSRPKVQASLQTSKTLPQDSLRTDGTVGGYTVLRRMPQKIVMQNFARELRTIESHQQTALPGISKLFP